MSHLTSLVRSTAIVLLSAGVGTAQADEYFGMDHTAIGAAELVEVPGGLSIRNLGHTGKDGVEITFPPMPDHVTRVDWDGHVADLTNPALSSAARVAALGTNGAGFASEACAMYVSLIPGDPTVTFDFSPLGPGSLSVRYFAGGALVHEETDVSPFGSIGLAAAQPADIGFSAHWDNIQKIYILDGTMSTERTFGGSVLPECDHFEVHFTGLPPLAIEGLAGVRMQFEGVPSVLVTDETLLVEALCPGDLDGDGVVGFTDLVALLGAWGDCPGCVTDLDGDGVVGFTDVVILLGAWGSCGG